MTNTGKCQKDKLAEPNKPPEKIDSYIHYLLIRIYFTNGS